jgi:hypothetical protein
VPYTMEQFRRDYVKEHWLDLTTEERREAMHRLPPEQRREVIMSMSLPPEERREVFTELPPEERLQTLSRQEIEDYLRQLDTAGSSRPEQTGGRKGRKKPKR